MSEARPRRWGWALVLFGFCGFLAWAALAPLDSGVSSPGTVVVTGSRKAVQSLAGGKIVELRARDGDVVKVGQVLVRLDDTQARSQLDIVRGQWSSAQAVAARLQAESAGRSAIAFPAALRDERADPRAAAAMALQSELLSTRRRAVENDLSALREQVRGLQSQLQGQEAALRARREQQRLLMEEIERQRDLVKDGFLPRNRLSEQERLQASIAADLAEGAGNLGRVRQQIAETQARMVMRESQQRLEVDTQLADVQRDVAAQASRLQALEFELASTEIRSPADGVVISLSVHTVGGVVAAGTPMMEIVPISETLKIEAQISPIHIDKVRAGLAVDVLFPAFQQATTPHIPGRLLTVSADALVEPKQGAQYFKAVIEVTPEGMKRLRDHQIRAGMPAEVFLRTGERTLLNYLLKPLRDRLNRALTEP
ncbi:HlyD family type I secretion periplasmic adaptor subunit [Paucibacter sp. DJ2R-2]|uniref:HlyD family type I secretion periplasmic adaptor subunit n=1 Tax=Paucibacter sp. DJ2R-2 TaxID=2893558 RepID=UPI0021E3C5B9|nr:HlyD family type I secretion periplasmic adaptor subunit [Paucibacter sp. DJ2R-2]MCV2440279.1 HlyD family type I secretion periplasmic adaptor subunit [Paucibacter sp. DJ2R-2]